jgi:hypothetical protein
MRGIQTMLLMEQKHFKSTIIFMDTAHKVLYVGTWTMSQFCEDLSGFVRGIQESNNINGSRGQAAGRRK